VDGVGEGAQQGATRLPANERPSGKRYVPDLLDIQAARSNKLQVVVAIAGRAVELQLEAVTTHVGRLAHDEPVGSVCLTVLLEPDLAALRVQELVQFTVHQDVLDVRWNHQLAHGAPLRQNETIPLATNELQELNRVASALHPCVLVRAVGDDVH